MIKVVDLNIDNEKFEPSVIGLGNFDGIHIGHRAIMKKVIEVAKEKNIASSVLLFKQHTNEVFPKMPPYYISSLQDKIDTLEEIGIDIAYTIDFTMEFAQLNNDEFILDFIRDHINSRYLVCGNDYTYGKRSLGTTKELLEYEKEGEIEVYLVDNTMYDLQKASSTTIRNAISEGDFETATELLTKPYKITGKVVHGENRGAKSLGFPTANLETEFSYIIPKDGLYITQTHVDNNIYMSITSVGTNPTFTDEESIKIETYILDFEQNIYGKEIQIEFIKLLRDQIKFDSSEELIEQMKVDEKETREYFENV